MRKRWQSGREDLKRELMAERLYSFPADEQFTAEQVSVLKQSFVDWMEQYKGGLEDSVEREIENEWDIST